MQESQIIHQFISDFPRIPKSTLIKILYSLKYRQKHFSYIGIGKRDGSKFNLSERQMSYIIDYMISYGFLYINKKVKGSRGYYCRTFSFSSVFQKCISCLQNIFQTIKTSTLSDRITKFNSQSSISFLKSFFSEGKKSGSYFKFSFSGKKFIVCDKDKGYKGTIFDSGDNKLYTLFNFMEMYFGLSTIETAKKLYIIG